MQAKIVAFGFNETLYSTKKSRLFNLQKLRAVIQGFKENGIRVVIVSTKSCRETALKVLDDAYGVNRDFLLSNDIFDLARAKELHPGTIWDQEGITINEYLYLAYKDHERKNSVKLSKNDLCFTDNSVDCLKAAITEQYSTYRFELVVDTNGYTHPEESFLDDFYTFVTGKRLTFAAGYVSASLYGDPTTETTPLVTSGKPAVAVESDSCCRCTLL